MSTAENAGRPVRPPSASSGSSRRAPYAEGGSAGGRGADGSDNTVRRRAEGEAGSGSAATTPVPVTRGPSSRGSSAPPPAQGAGPSGPAGSATVVTSGQPSSAPAGAKPAPRPPAARRVRLTVSRVDPWSAMKIAFLLSVALGIAGVVMVFVLWTILAGMGVFDQINGIIGQVVQDGQQRFDIMDYIGLGRVVSLSIVIAVIDVVLVTAIATLAAFLYNVSSALVGGVQLTLTDD